MVAIARSASRVSKCQKVATVRLCVSLVFCNCFKPIVVKAVKEDFESLEKNGYLILFLTTNHSGYSDV